MKKITLFFLIVLFSQPIIAQKNIYSIDDLITITKSQFGFVKPDGIINEYYGDIEFTSPEQKIIEFNVGCGRGGDIVELTIKPSPLKPNTFDMFILKGGIYYGTKATIDKKVGELLVKSETEISGTINLCLEKNASCCGEEGPNFILKKIK